MDRNTNLYEMAVLPSLMQTRGFRFGEGMRVTSYVESAHAEFLATEVSVLPL